MQTYTIVFAPTAHEDLDQALSWLSQQAPEKVAEWFQAIKTEIETLETLPERCPFAPENGLWGNEELRQLLFQQYPSKYRIIFTVDNVGNQVKILNIRHGARRFLYEK